MPPRAYFRTDPHWYERKVLGVDADGVPIEGWSPYPRAALVAFMGVLALADQQPQRGYFRGERLLRELLRGVDGAGRDIARQVPLLIARGDLIEQAGGRLYVDGWADWQEGDLTVAERMRRMRAKKAERNGVTPAVTVPNVTGRHARVARGRSAEAVSISNSGGGDAVTRTDGLSTDDRARAIAANRALLGSDDVTVQRAAIRALRKLDPDTEWALPAPSTRPAARPKG